MTPALFLDRDGVLIENRPNYVRRWTDVTFYPDALAQLALISQLPLKVVIITNQSVVGRNLISLRAAQAINARLVETIGEAGGRIDAVYMCPHAPRDNCRCRKPLPGLFMKAATELALDLNRSIMIGDALTDLVAAAAAGIPRRILVRTGRGSQQEKLAAAHTLMPFATYDSLAPALQREVANVKVGSTRDARLPS